MVDERKKSVRRNDIDLNSESDYEDKSEQSEQSGQSGQSYGKHVSYNDYFTTLKSTINDIKTEIKNPQKANEKIDIILEYILNPIEFKILKMHMKF